MNQTSVLCETTGADDIMIWESCQIDPSRDHVWAWCCLSGVLWTLSTVQSVCGSPMRNLALPFLLVTVITCYTLIQNINQSSQIAVKEWHTW